MIPPTTSSQNVYQQNVRVMTMSFEIMLAQGVQSGLLMLQVMQIIHFCRYLDVTLNQKGP